MITAIVQDPGQLQFRSLDNFTSADVVLRKPPEVELRDVVMILVFGQAGYRLNPRKRPVGPMRTRCSPRRTVPPSLMTSQIILCRPLYAVEVQ